MKSLSDVIHQARMIQKEMLAEDLIQDFFELSLPVDNNFLSPIDESLYASPSLLRRMKNL